MSSQMVVDPDRVVALPGFQVTNLTTTRPRKRSAVRTAYLVVKTPDRVTMHDSGVT